MLKLPLTFVVLVLKGYFLHINLWFTLSELTWSDLPSSAKC